MKYIYFIKLLRILEFVGTFEFLVFSSVYKVKFLITQAHVANPAHVSTQNVKVEPHQLGWHAGNYSVHPPVPMMDGWLKGIMQQYHHITKISLSLKDSVMVII